MRFILCMLLMFAVGLSMSYITADAVQLQDSSYLPTEFDVGDLELAKLDGSTLEDPGDLYRALAKTSNSGDICTGANYINQDNTGNTLQAKTQKNYVTTNSYGLLFRCRTHTYTYTNSTAPVITYLVPYLDLPFEVGWQA